MLATLPTTLTPEWLANRLETLAAHAAADDQWAEIIAEQEMGDAQEYERALQFIELAFDDHCPNGESCLPPDAREAVHEHYLAIGKLLAAAYEHQREST